MKRLPRPRVLLLGLRNRIRPKRPYLLLVIAAVLLLALLFTNRGLRPLIREYALAMAQNLATQAINSAVSDELTAGAIGYADLVTLEKDVQGRVTALHTNIVKTNQLKSQIANVVVSRLLSMRNAEIGIPSGSLTGIDLLNGRGPRIPVQLVPVGSATATFKSVFTTAGINQTRHRIMMEVSVKITALMPGDSVSTEVTTQISVAETLIIGVVPESYTYIEDGSGDPATEKYQHYGDD